MIENKELSFEQTLFLEEIQSLKYTLDALIDEMFEKETQGHEWISIGKTYLQHGLMALEKAIKDPDSF